MLTSALARLIPARDRRDVVWTGTALVVSRVAMIVAAVITARPLGPAGKGIVTAVVTWSQILAWLSIAGMNTAASVRVAGSRMRCIGNALGTALVFSAVSGGVVAALGAIILPRSLAHLGGSARPLVFMTLALAPFIVLTEILLAIQLAIGHVRQYNVSRMLQPLVTMGVAVGGVTAGAMTPELLVIGVVAGALVSCGAALPRLPWNEVRVSSPMLLEDLRFGLKLMVASLMSSANARLDVLLMSFWLAAGSIGTYSLANNIMSPVDIAASTLAVLITPAVARIGRRPGHAGHTAQVDRVRRDAIRSSVWAACAVIPLAAAAPVLVPLVFGHAFAPAVPLIWILAPGYVCRCFASVVISGAAGMRRPWAASIVEGAGLVGSVILLPILLLSFGTVGAAVATTVSFGASAVAATCLLRLPRDRVAEHERDDTLAVVATTEALGTT